MKNPWNGIMLMVIKSWLPLAAKKWAFNHLKGETVEKEFVSEEELGEFANFFKEGK